MRGLITLVCAVCVCVAGGCSADQPQSRYVEKPRAVYEGLKGHSAAVMVWADSRTRADYNKVEIDTAKRLTDRLSAAKKDGKKAATQAASSGNFLNPASVVRYQREHPEILSMPIDQVAPRLGVQRVIYVEIVELSAHSQESIMVLKGSAKATLRVLEVDGDNAKVVFEEADISANFPPDQPEGVIPSDKWNVRTIYDGTLDLLADKLAVRFKS